MEPKLLFCYGCNERFAALTALTDEPVCPRCGEAVGEMKTLPSVDATALSAREPIDTQTRDDELVGSVLGTYRVDALAGKGGMGMVYRAFHLTLERPCALKILSSKLRDESTQYIDMFVDEARAAASLVHPNIVTVHNIGEDRGRHFIEMEYVDGCSSSQLLDKGRIGPARATALMMQTAAGLSEAHRHGVVHRDLKPGNILVSEDGAAKLADFGLAKRVIGDTRGLVGTPYFMAPELFDGSAASTESDIYAAGVSFYFLLTGELPFAAATLPDVIRCHREQSVPDARAVDDEVPERAQRILATCLAKRGAERYSDGAALHDELLTLFGRLRDLGDLVDDALDGFGVTRLERNVYEARVELPGGRSQRVLIEKASELLRVSSLCAPADDSYTRTALELNANIPHGAIAIRAHEGVPYFVTTGVYPWATCAADELRDCVLSIARWGDEVERTLTGRDVH